MFGNTTAPTFPPGRWRPRIFARNKPATAFTSRPESAESATVEPASTTDTSVQERALIQRAQGGDLSAYDELVRRYQERVYATLYHMTSNHEDAHDLAQEAFVKAWQAIKSFKGDSSFYTWVYRIAVNKTINHLKTRRNRTPHLSLNDLDFNAEHDPGLVQFILPGKKAIRRTSCWLKIFATPKPPTAFARSFAKSAIISKATVEAVKDRRMSEPHPEEFEQLRKLLALKRHEQPPPGYFGKFSGQVIARIESAQPEPKPSLWRQLTGGLFQNPALAGAYGIGAIAAVVLGLAIFSAETKETAMTTPPTAPPTAPAFAAQPSPLPVPTVVAMTSEPQPVAVTLAPLPVAESASSTVNVSLRPVLPADSAPAGLFPAGGFLNAEPRLNVDAASFRFPGVTNGATPSNP
ncbi:MAG: sigma-70 family RNA polymerase sigma factor [Verrucomicrobia bacterium]|nr:sigma-70 family RNA polymerase sigma factor [Verrucomicrobiota bacterium]